MDMIELDWPLIVTPKLGEAVADGTGQHLGEYHRRQRDPEEDRRSVDDDQQEDHQRDRGEQQRSVDALEDLDRVGRVAGAAGDLDLEAAARVGDRVAPEVDRIEDVVGLAVALDVGGDDGRLAVLRADRPDEGRVVVRLPGDRRGRAGAALGQVSGGGAAAALVALALAARRRGGAVRHHCREAFLRQAPDVLDDLLPVGRREARLAPVQDDRRGELAALQVLGRREHLGRLGVARQERGRLVLLRVHELAWEVGARAAMKMPTSQMRKTTHLARRPAAMAKIERRGGFMDRKCYRYIS